MTSPLDLPVDVERLWQSLEDFAAIGATPGGGVHRLSLSEEDGRARASLAELARQSGLTVRRDGIGNLFAIRHGSDPQLPAVLMGSHLDSQPAGGRYDGAYGVLAGLEVLRTLTDREIVTRRSVILANWTNEEGARFAPSMMGSAVYAGNLALDEALLARDAEGVSVAEALDVLGERGELPVSAFALHRSFEVHIEQGPVLEREGLDVGIVHGVQALRWLDVTLTGSPGHAGTVPQRDRADALLAAARVLQLVAELADRIDPRIRATAGALRVWPNSRNVIPGQVRMELDLRHPDVARLDDAETLVRDLAAELAAGTPVHAEVRCVLDQPAVDFDPATIGLVRRAADAAGTRHRSLVSGAGHDAAQLAAVVPTAMAFIPCVDGLSHHEREDITPAWSAAGVRVLGAAVLAATAEPDTAEPHAVAPDTIGGTP